MADPRPPVPTIRRRLAAVAVLGLLAPAPVAAGAAPAYGDGTGVFLGFLDGPAATRPPRLGLSFGGETKPVVMDTGSTGIVVSAARIPGIDALPSRPGRLTYSSSGRIMIGRWVTVPATVTGRDGASVTTRPLPVLAVDRIDCTARARSCRPALAPAGVAMMGIGFGREADSQSQSTPDTNPLLGIDPAAGPMRRGYVVTREGVHVGLTRANTAGDFRFVALDPYPGIAGEWRGVPVCIRVGDAPETSCGRALMDTGVGAMYLTLPPAAVAATLSPDDRGRPALAPGTRLTFTFPDDLAGGGPAARYAVTVGDADAPLAPSRVVLNTTRPEPFVNTGLHVLDGYDLLYDADGGFYGFRGRDTRRAGGP
ncbi:hypothetical protein [uncultured Methylobacterium sp.]|jgi:hypothetical protein|uniref:hypothetical protein n=1 Tax=uncultured Methylobacterium sp. TaxID=157278 RepID=UPI002613357A|nr:hypothetical protein [uncultured Methylobacterium sp.]